MKTKSMYLLGALTAGSLLVGNPAQAASDPNESVTITAAPDRDFFLNDNDFRSEQISYSDQDLSGPRYGRLVTRITTVAGRLCDEVSKPDVWNLDERQTCVNGAVNDAIRQIHMPSDQRLAFEELRGLYGS